MTSDLRAWIWGVGAALTIRIPQCFFFFLLFFSDRIVNKTTMRRTENTRTCIIRVFHLSFLFFSFLRCYIYLLSTMNPTKTVSAESRCHAITPSPPLLSYVRNSSLKCRPNRHPLRHDFPVSPEGDVRPHLESWRPQWRCLVHQKRRIQSTNPDSWLNGY